MTPEERCNRLKNLNSLKKWSPKDHEDCAEQLRELLGTPEGSELLERYTEKKQFGKARAFHREAAGQLEDLFRRRPENSTWASNVRRFAAALFKATQANWEERWRCLSFLQKTGSGKFATSFLPVFRKDCEKNWLRVIELGESKGLSREECVGLLEAARSTDLQREEELALETTLTELGLVPPSPPLPDPLVEDLAVFVEEVRSAAVRFHERRRAAVAELEPLRHQVADLQARVRELETALVDARREPESAQVARDELQQACEELVSLHGKVAELEGERAELRKDAAEAREEVRGPRQAHEQREQERQQLDREIKELREAVEAEAEKVAAVNREKESILKMFRFRVWEGLKPYFADVKDEPAAPESEDGEREKFFYRLRQIREILRRAEIPPV
jgi:hypothetical protein